MTEPVVLSESAEAAAGKPPALTTILVTPTGARFLRRTVQAMAAQTQAHRIELIIAAPTAEMDDVAPLLPVFHSVRVHPVGPITNVDFAVGRTMPFATAPIIASIEDHAFPDADWAEILLAAYDSTDAVAIGSAVLNANPQSGLSWANILLAYNQWSEGTPEGRIDWISHHNGSFRRRALERFNPDDYWAWFTREGTIVHKLAEAGGTFHFAPDARVRHLNPSKLTSTFALRRDVGRLYAANRMHDEGWGIGKRAAYAVLSPAIPFLRYLRMRKEIFGRRAELSEIKHGPAMFVGLAFDALGQMIGYVAGMGGARERLATFEMDRLDHLSKSDLAVFRPVSEAT